MLLRLQERLATRSRVDRQWHFYRGGHGGERFQMQWSVGTDECRWAGPAANTRAGCGWDGTGVWARRVGLAPAYLLCTGRLWLQVVHTLRRPPEGLEADKLAAHSGCRSSALSCSVHQARALASAGVGRRSRCCKHARCPGLPHEGSTQAGWVGLCTRLRARVERIARHA